MTQSDYTIRKAKWPEERELLRQVREPVFVEEQGVPQAMEWDDDDMMAYHLLALDQAQRPIATARLLGNGQIGRMAVLPEWRNQGIGTALLLTLIQHADSIGLQSLFLHAQTSAEPFYAKAGFTADGDHFMEAGIEHQKMVLSFNQDMAEELFLAQLGKTPELFHLHTVEDHQAHATCMVRQAKRHLSIFTRTLDPQIFDTPPFVDAVQQLATRSRFSRIRILLQDNTLVVQQGHQLVELAQRLSTAIEIRIPGDEYMDYEENFMLVDELGYLHRKQAVNLIGTACYNDRYRANRMQTIFNEAWEFGTPDRELARLHL
ncbi:GNAT family N-acetyltransferase [Candidatus Thiodiazotropha sp. CDECU1]|uniref:GNAT family N-acetyltransferase n=1 Tax=Candidatus Thiodiazotropha sp. CDECU1 TaxID=3065865 RepID=UPI00292DD7E6|nr:GNAT family N-acetyltransferase [Candidatus Thiodiazotropha sp. CDECU1]